MRFGARTRARAVEAVKGIYRRNGPRVRDGAAVALGIFLTLLAAKTPWAAPPRPVILLAGCVGSGALWWRQRWPASTALVGTGAYVLSGNPWPLAVGVSTTASRRRDLVMVAVTMAAGVGLALPVMITLGRFDLMTVLFHTAAAVFFAMVGAYLGTRQELLASLRERAERAEAEREMRAEQARAAERARIAREMHDVLAHKVSLIALHAGALEVNPDADRSRVEEVAGIIRTTARHTLDELRTVLGILRAEADPTPDPDTPVPTGTAADSDTNVHIATSATSATSASGADNDAHVDSGADATARLVGAGGGARYGTHDGHAGPDPRPARQHRVGGDGDGHAHAGTSSGFVDADGGGPGGGDDDHADPDHRPARQHMLVGDGDDHAGRHHPLTGHDRLGAVDDDLAPQPRTADVRRMVAASRQAGVAVELRIGRPDQPDLPEPPPSLGSPAPDWPVGVSVREVPAGVGSPAPDRRDRPESVSVPELPELPELPDATARTVYRVIQEALTNVHKHAPGASTVVSISGGETVGVTVSVVNGPSGTTAGALLPGSGAGLVGLRERLRLAGGTLGCGPRPGGGWRLDAWLPWSPVALTDEAPPKTTTA